MTDVSVDLEIDLRRCDKEERVFLYCHGCNFLKSITSSFFLERRCKFSRVWSVIPLHISQLIFPCACPIDVGCSSLVKLSIWFVPSLLPLKMITSILLTQNHIHRTLFLFHPRMNRTRERLIITFLFSPRLVEKIQEESSTSDKQCLLNVWSKTSTRIQRGMSSDRAVGRLKFCASRHSISWIKIAMVQSAWMI